jgi:formylglycine-generating enzyme required for sulfatase activity
MPVDRSSMRFYHQLLQEYFAALELRRRVLAGEALSRYWTPDWWEPSGWEETFILLAGMKPDSSALLDRLVEVNPIVAARSLVESDAQINEITRRAIVAQSLKTMEMQSVSAVARVQSGSLLAKLGDPRFREDAWYLPNEPMLGFIEIPAGPFLMGSDPKHIDYYYEIEGHIDSPWHVVELPTYYIARYPVTVAQYAAFVKRSSHQSDQRRLRYNRVSNHPVVDVTLYDAQAYCMWLTEQLRDWSDVPALLAVLLRKGWQVRLPTEAEWEKAARGTDGRIYPWGNEIDSEYANYRDTGIGETSAVGCFPNGASPYGALDLGGNVYEWCELHLPAEKRRNLSRKARRVMRGGAFHSPDYSLRCARDVDRDPRNWDNVVGFRTVFSPDLTSDRVSAQGVYKQAKTPPHAD